MYIYKCMYMYNFIHNVATIQVYKLYTHYYPDKWAIIIGLHTNINYRNFNEYSQEKEENGTNLAICHGTLPLTVGDYLCFYKTNY